ncbi:MAG: hypothetical protein LBI54_10260 [Lachnospiraceae bacterium]|jgi:hypothetical protein|nr:hypothetical protein [Lachnospiraceae bacterium]
MGKLLIPISLTFFGGGEGAGGFDGTRGSRRQHRQEKAKRQQGKRPKSNKAQNAQFGAVAAKLKLTPKQKRNLHDDLKKTEAMGRNELLEHAEAMFNKQKEKGKRKWSKKNKN